MGFVKGRSISENFSYAANLQNCCHKCKAPTMVIKLDIRKDFDSVSWETLNKLLLIRGFLSTFCQWIQNILITCKTAILINGVPRTWIQCKKGLRQGDPISPYLYIIFSDILQQLILFFFAGKSTIFYSSRTGLQSAKTSLEIQSRIWCSQQVVLPPDLPLLAKQFATLFCSRTIFMRLKSRRLIRRFTSSIRWPYWDLFFIGSFRAANATTQSVWIVTASVDHSTARDMASMIALISASTASLQLSSDR
jgi:hypothetical protein